MASMARRYTTAVRDETKLFAAWPIGTSVALGDVGFLSRRGKMFDRRSNLSNFNIPISERVAKNLTGIDVTLARGLKMRFKASGAVPPPGSMLTPADVGVSLAFGRRSSVVVRARCRETAIENLHELEAAVLAVSADPNARWHRDFVIVTSIYESLGTTVFLASGRKLMVDITAGAGVEVPFHLADARIGLSAVAGSDKFISALAEPGFVPFFGTHHLIGHAQGAPRLSLYGRAA